MPEQSTRGRGRRPGRSGTTMDMAVVFRVGVEGGEFMMAFGYAEIGLQLWEWEWESTSMFMLKETSFCSVQREQRASPHWMQET
jgi:hypothetical protein